MSNTVGNFLAVGIFGVSVGSLTDNDFKPTVFIPFLIGIIIISVILSFAGEAVLDKLKKWTGNILT